MKAFSAPTTSSLTFPASTTVHLRLAAMALIVSLPFIGVCQTDSFDDGDAAGWTVITNSSFPATYSFPADAFGGKAYRLQGGTPPGTVGAGNTARVAAYRADRSYTNFYVAADILTWDTTFTNDQAFGVMARANDVESGFISAAILVMRINRFIQTSTASSRGQVYIYNLVSGTTPNNAAAAAAECTLVPGHQYRFVFMGTNDGTKDFFTGLIYDLEDLTRPLVTLSGDSILSTLFQYPWPASGYSGVFAFNLGTNPADRGTTTDTTFDNFVASELPPTSVAMPATPHGLAAVPQVFNRSPASFANFHPATSGITFNATTLTTSNAVVTNSIRLYLNNVDESHALNITGPTTNAIVSFSGLTSNAVYDARIELVDSLGRRTTNAWTFDTFDEAYLDSPRAKNIECEDYDFQSGSFLDAPPPSGFPTNGAAVINSGLGYVDLVGSNAKPPVGGVDFFDYDSNPQARENEFRFSDSVGTQQGTMDALYSDGNDPSILVYRRVYETQRQKYSRVSPALQEYLVRRTEGGEWLNYTRVFSASNYYNVYLRAGCRQPQLLWLGALPSTNSLGSFAVPSSISQYNYRYIPLRDSSGNLAVVNLSGTNTLRLTVGGPQMEGTKQGISMNYLAFVPALLVESSPQVNGPFTIETNASVEPGTQRVTIPVSGDTRFFRLRWDRAVNITSIRRNGEKIELSFQ